MIRTWRHPISRNTLFKLASELLGRGASFALGLWAARQLGSFGFGEYNVGLAQGFVLAQLGDMGLQMLISREVAVKGEAARAAVQMALRWKWVMGLPVVILFWLFSAGRPPLVRLSFMGLGLAMLAQTFLEYAAYVFRGQQRLRVEAQLLASTRLLTALSGGLALWWGGGLPGLALATLASVSLMAAWALYRLGQSGWFTGSRGCPLPLTGPFARALWQQALPLGAATFLSISYTRLPIFWLEARAGAAAVAQFSAAQRLVEPTQILPASFLAALFPVFSQALYHDPDRARRLGWRSSLLLSGSGAAVAIVLWLAAPWLISRLYGAEFNNSVPVLRVLSLSILPAFINYSLTHYLIARSQQRWLTLFMGVMLLLHGGVSWLLIPFLGAVGPAISIIIAETTLLLACLTVLSNEQSSHRNTS